MTTVGISGAPGKMGRLTLATVQGLDDLVVSGLFAPGHDGETIDGHAVSGDRMSLSDCDVVIELTNPDVAPANVSIWREQGSQVVIGTSGYDSDKVAALETEWTGSDQRCLVVPNFSIGAVLMMRFAEMAAPHFESAEIVEMHHHDKPDAPSGTSLNTAARISAARHAAGIEPHGPGRGAGRWSPGRRR